MNALGTRIALAVILGAAGALAGVRLAPSIAMLHYVVRQADQVRFEEEHPKSATTLESDSFRDWGMSKETLYADANAVLRRFRLGTPIAGAFIGIAFALVATGFGSRRRRNIYEIDSASCVSCGRCFASCPIEQKRRRQATGSPRPTPSPDSETARPRRHFLIAAMVLSALFSGAVGGVMVLTLVEESQTVTFPESPAVAEMERQIKAHPDSETLKAEARELDARDRQQGQIRVERLRVGAWMLLVGLVALAGSARLYMLSTTLEKPKRPVSPPDVTARRFDRVGQVAALGILLAALCLLLRPAKPVRDFVIAPTTMQAHPQGVYHDNWPSFRGDGMGVVPADNYPVEWDNSGRNVRWKVAVPLPGKSSPIVWGSRIFVTGADNEHQTLFCFDRTDGHILWQTEIRSPETIKRYAGGPEAGFGDSIKDTSYAAPTPVTDGKHVFALFVGSDIASVDFDGHVKWVKNFGVPQSPYGLAASLAFANDTLIFQYDQGGSAEDSLSAILGLDPNSGEAVWHTPRAVSATWCSPVVARTPKGPVIIASGTPYVAAYDPQSGTELWRCSGMGSDLAPSPVYSDGKVYATGQGGKALAIRMDSKDDVTETGVVWSQDISLSDAPSPLATPGWFFQATSSGTATCFSAAKGDLLWRRNFRGGFWSSPTLVGDVVYLSDEDGRTHLFKAAPGFQEVRVNSLGEPIYASPAFGDGQIIIRGAKHLFCISAKK